MRELFRICACSLAGVNALVDCNGADWPPEAGARSIPLPVPAMGKTGFTLVPGSQSGITFTNLVPEQRHLTNQILLNGSGVAAGDVDADGLPDIFLCRLGGPSALYLNLGNWKFKDVAAEAGVDCPDLDATGAAFADLDGDGDLDLIVNSVGGGTHVFLNDGKGHFKERLPQLNIGKGGMSLALGDIDGDGYLDLYIANYRTSGLMDMPNARATFKTVNGKVMIERLNGRLTTQADLTNRFIVSSEHGVEEMGEPDVLYRNVGGTNFVAIPFTGGAFLDEQGFPLKELPYDWGLSVMFRDINGDGRPDIYVCNDFYSPDRIWINQGGGKFRAISPLALRKTSRYSMGVDFADINRDGADDFIVLDMLSRSHLQRMSEVMDLPVLVPGMGDLISRPQYSLNTLFLNRGDGTYAEIAQFSGVDASEWSWTPIFLDVDLDGWEDLLISNGQERAARDLDVVERLKSMRAEKHLTDAQIFQARKMFPRLATANVAFRNQQNLTFREISHEWGFDLKAVSNGMCLADLDGDGDLDVIVNNFNDAAALFRNESNAPRVAVRLKGLAGNSHGIGAKIRVVGGAVPMQSQEMICGGRYLSGDDAMRVFAAGTLTNRMTIEVDWPRGRRSVVNNVFGNRIYEIDEAASSQPPALEVTVPNFPERSNTRTLFEDASTLISHSHHEDPYDDFARQPLLPKKLSQLGPGVAWYDLDADGNEDLIIGSGKSGPLAALRNNGHGGFDRLNGPPWDKLVTRDQTAILGWNPEAAQTSILAGAANYEDSLNAGGELRQYDFGAKAVTDLLPVHESSVGPIAMADIDGDGDLDLFVGGRVIAGKYPEAATSRIYQNEGGKFTLRQELAKIGLISAAIWSDLDGDGFPELILASEWGPLRVFHNAKGRLHEVTRELSLAAYTGWWNGVHVGDFDGDGKLDLVASNWGLNSAFHASQTSPEHLYYWDSREGGSIQLVRAYFDEQIKAEVPWEPLTAMAAAMPDLRQRFPNNAAYGAASLQQIFRNELKGAHLLEAITLTTMIFLNRGDHFEPRLLPAEAQFAPAFGICVGDFDGDGNEDLFLAQNFFDLRPLAPRNDAGRGLFLRSDGKGYFAAVPGQDSGIKLYGEQRGAAVADYDRDGRLDLVVTQNGSSTALFHNVTAKPGLAVRLLGPAGNPRGVGAQLWMESPQAKSALKEIHAGSGYWSQDSATLLFPILSNSQLHVRWPGGRSTSSQIPASAMEITVNTEGVVKNVR